MTVGPSGLSILEPWPATGWPHSIRRVAPRGTPGTRRRRPGRSRGPVGRRVRWTRSDSQVLPRSRTNHAQSLSLIVNLIPRVSSRETLRVRHTICGTLYTLVETLLIAHARIVNAS